MYDTTRLIPPAVILSYHRRPDLSSQLWILWNGAKYHCNSSGGWKSTI